MINMYNTINKEKPLSGVSVARQRKYLLNVGSRRDVGDNMKIETIDIKYHFYGRFRDNHCDNVRNIKSLPWLSVVQAETGRYSLRLGDSDTYEIPTSGFFIAPSQVTQDIVHHVDQMSGTMNARWLFIEIEVNGGYKLEHLYNFPAVVGGEASARLNRLFDDMFASRTLCERMSIYYRIIDILLDIASPRSVMLAGNMLDIAGYIASNYSRDISVAELAARAHMSESNFYAVFRRNFGMSPMAYLNRYRLSAASVLLTRTDLTIAEVASSVGYTDPLYFSRQFHRLFQSSPRDYRKAGV